MIGRKFQVHKCWKNASAHRILFREIADRTASPNADYTMRLPVSTPRTADSGAHLRVVSLAWCRKSSGSRSDRHESGGGWRTTAVAVIFGKVELPHAPNLRITMMTDDQMPFASC